MRLPLLPFAQAPLVVAELELGGAPVSEDALTHQRMRGVERRLDRFEAVPFLAGGDIALGEVQIIEDAGGIAPLLEEVIVLEEVVVTEGGVGDDQRLHRHRVLLHAIANAWVGVDHDLIGERLVAPAVERFVAHETLAVGPMGVHQRHADGAIGVEHLLGRNDLDLVRKDVEAEFVAADPLDRLVDPPHSGEVPFGALEQEAAARRRRVRRKIRPDHCAAAFAVCLAKSSRRTG